LISAKEPGIPFYDPRVHTEILITHTHYTGNSATTGGTLTATKRYLTQNIEMLRPGDLVLSRSETDPSGQNVLRRIEEVFVRRVQSLQILTVRSSCGTLQTLYTTQVHPVYINTRGWVDAGHIHVGDQILEPTGGLATVTASRFENHPDGILVYNFRVSRTHTYFVREQGSTAEPLWVHNIYLASEVDAAEMSLGFGEMSANGEYLGVAEKGFPGVGVTENGGPTFANSPYLHPTVDPVEIELTGSRLADEKAANAAAGLKETPQGFVWHHVDDFDAVTGTSTMELVQQSAHQATLPHSGSVAQWERFNNRIYGR
jgi:hypothetical protein